MDVINTRFIALPYCLTINKLGLHYKDFLTYVAIRSFNNTTYDKCFPSYESIAERAGVSKMFMQQSLQRLVKAQLLTVAKSSKKRVSNRYSFPKLEAFNMIPYEFFDAELSPCEKGMLLCLRQFFVSGDHRLTVNGIPSVAFGLGVSYKTVYTQYKSLVSKGYISETIKRFGDGYQVKVIKLTDKINWTYGNKPSLDVVNRLKLSLSPDGKYITIDLSDIVVPPVNNLSSLIFC